MLLRALHTVAVAIDGHGSRNEYFDSSEEYFVTRLKPVVDYINHGLSKLE